MPTDDRKKSRVTLLDVARHANVSRATASLVIRKSPLVGTATREKVEKALQELGYVYNMGAASLRADRSNTVGVIVPTLGNPFTASFWPASTVLSVRLAWLFCWPIAMRTLPIRTR